MLVLLSNQRNAAVFHLFQFWGTLTGVEQREVVNSHASIFAINSAVPPFLWIVGGKHATTPSVENDKFIFDKRGGDDRAELVVNTIFVGSEGIGEPYIARTNGNIEVGRSRTAVIVGRHGVHARRSDGYSIAGFARVPTPRNIGNV